MTIECIGFRSVTKGVLQGFANFWVPKMGIEIFGCGVFMKDGRRWINLPSREYKDESGETKYIQVMRFKSKEHSGGFSEAAKKALDKWCMENNQQSDCISDSEEEECPF